MTTTTIYALSLEDALKATFDQYRIGSNPSLTALLSYFATERNISLIDLDSYLSDLWTKIMGRYHKKIIAVSNLEITNKTLASGIADDWFINLCNIMNNTKDRYELLLEIYSAQKNNLLNKVSQNSTRSNTLTSNSSNTNDSSSKMNDTPQSGADFTSDPYTTTASIDSQNGTASGSSTSNESYTYSSDMTTLMSRISEISNQYQNLMQEWVKEFSKIFIEEFNFNEE